MIENDLCKYINNKVEETIIKNSLINNNDKIVVAVSGGPDSMCLLNVSVSYTHLRAHET